MQHAKRIFSLSVLLGVVIWAATAYATQISSSARCPFQEVCEIGNTSVTGMTIYGANDESITIGTTDSTLTLQTDGTETATFTGADAAGASNTTYDTTGAGIVTLGSSDVTTIALVTDGGTITVDGYVNPIAKVTSLASGTLTVNTVHLATATADYDLPDSCDSATGNWVTVVVSDPSETISIGLTDTSDVIEVGGLNLDADDELDSPTAAVTSDGSSITLTCLATNTWYSTAIVGTWVDGGAAD